MMNTSLLLVVAGLCLLPAPRALCSDAPHGAGQSAAQREQVAKDGELAEAARLGEAAAKLYGEGKHAEALTAATRALEIRERALGPGHPLVATSLINVAAILQEQKKLAEAEASLRRALAITEKSEGTGSVSAAEVVTRLALIRLQRGDAGGAEDLLLAALSAREKTLGPQDPGLVQPLFNLGEFYLYRSGFKKAEPFYERAMTILESQPPKKDLASAQKLKEYLCPLAPARGDESLDRVQRLITRLEDPDTAAENERRLKEASAGDASGPLAVGGVLAGKAVSKPAPSYPPEARSARATGTVLVKIVVDEGGRVTAAEVICGHPLLRSSAVQAAKKWRFTPTLLSGKPVEVSGFVRINYVFQ